MTTAYKETRMKKVAWIAGMLLLAASSLPAQQVREILNGSSVLVPTTNISQQSPNDPAGTTLNLLMKLTPTGAIVAGTSDTAIPVYIVTAGAGTTGNAEYAIAGQAPCTMDATLSNTEGFYVIASTTTGGRCHAQSAKPSGGIYLVGMMVSTSTTSGAVATVQVQGGFIGGGGSLATTTGGAAPAGQTYDFSAASLTLPTSTPCTLIIDGQICYDSSIQVDLIRIGGFTAAVVGNFANGVATSCSIWVTPILLGNPTAGQDCLRGTYTLPQQKDFACWNASGVNVNCRPGVPNTDKSTTPTASYAFAAVDLGNIITRANGGAAMTDTAPDVTAAGFTNKWYTRLWNLDSSATDTVSKSATSTLNGQNSITLPPKTYCDFLSTDVVFNVLCSRFIRGGTNITEVVNADGSVTFNAASGGTPALSSVTASIANSAIANGNNTETWNSAQTTDAQSAMTFGETSAATGGTLTSGRANQALVSFSTASNSTAAPVSIVQGSITSTAATPALQGQTTWNNASLVGKGILFNVTNTASAVGARVLELDVNNSAVFSVDVSGNIPVVGLISSGQGVRASSSTSSINFTGGSDTSQNGTLGSGTFKGGDNSGNTATNAGGAATLRGGDETGASAATVGGAATVRGGNVSSTSASSTPGAASITGGGFTGAATNATGADATVAGGLGTGSGNPSSYALKSPAIGASGTTPHVQILREFMQVKSTSLTSGTATTFFNIPVAANQTVGFAILVHVETTQATPQNCSTTQSFWVAVQNTSATITSNVSNGTAATICSTGTLTLALTVSAANPTVVSITPSWTTIVPTGVIVTAKTTNLSQQDVTRL